MLIRRPGQAWHPLEPVLHDERALQTLLAQSPGLIPSNGPGELAVAANFRMGSAGSVDILGIGSDGRIVLVECGRQDGPGRRPMGGASLGVAAALWRAPFEEFDQAFAGRAGVSVVEAVSTLAQAAGVGWQEADFRQAVQGNLDSGRFGLVLAVDTVTDEVRKVVSYLNGGARPGLAAVALGLRYLAEEGIEILFPTVFRGDDESAGTSPSPAEGSSSPPAPRAPSAASTPVPTNAAAAVPPAAATGVVTNPATPAPAASAGPGGSSAPAPSAGGSSAPAGAAAPSTLAAAPPAERSAEANGQAEARLFAALESSCLPPAVESVRRLFDLARVRGRELQWGDGEHPSVTAVFDVGGRPVGVWSCYTDMKPSFVVNFEWLVPHVATEQLKALADHLGQLQSVPERLAGLAEAGYRRRLALAVNAVLAQPGASDVIASGLSELLERSAPATTGTSGSKT